MKKRLMIVIVIFSIIITAEAKTIEDDEHFQRLIDVKLFNSTDLFPEYIVQTALIPTGFFDSLEKKINSSVLNRRITNKETINNRYDSTYNIINGKYITFTGDVKKLWNGSSVDKLSTVIPDIDGDGLGDILMSAQSYDSNTGLYSYIFEIRKGKNGKILWSETFSGNLRFTYMMPAGDLNRDGSGDMLIYMAIYNPSIDTYDNKLIAKNGTDGTTLWELLFENAWVSPYPAGDTDGAEVGGYYSDDILLNILYPSSNVYVVKVITGLTGDVIWSSEYTSGDWYESIQGYPAGKLDNWDTPADILINKKVRFCFWSTCYYFHEVRAVDVAEHRNIWSETRSGDNINGDIYFYGWPLYKPIFGPGDDVFDVYTDYHPQTGSYEIEVKHGYSGSTMWINYRDRSLDYAFLLPTNDLDGEYNNGLTNDVLLHVYRNYPSPQYYSISARKGSDGSFLWAYSAIADKFSYIYAYPAGDLDGDRLEDIVVNLVEEGTENIYKTVRSAKGTNGYILWDDSIYYKAADGYKELRGYPAGDINKDNLNDVSISNGTDARIFNISLRTGKDGTYIWRATTHCCWIGIGYGLTNDLPLKKPTWKYNDFNGDGYYDTLLTPYSEIYAVTGDIKPPASVTNLRNITYQRNYIKWVWNDPTDSDFAKVKVYIDGVWKRDVLKGVQFYNLTGLLPNTWHKISTKTVDINGNINRTWINKTAKTARDYIPPASISQLRNITYKRNYINWTWKDPIDSDFAKVKIYINGVYKKDVLKGIRYYNATGLKNNTWYKISTHTVDTSGNINKTWVNKTTRTAI